VVYGLVGQEMDSCVLDHYLVLPLPSLAETLLNVASSYPVKKVATLQISFKLNCIWNIFRSHTRTHEHLM